MSSLKIGLAQQLIRNLPPLSQIPGKKRYGGSDRDVGIVFYYDGSIGSIRWRIRTDNVPEFMKSEGYEKAQTFTGPFPLLHITNYLNIAQYKVYNQTEANVDAIREMSRGMYNERDFILHIVIYLEHMMSIKEDEHDNHSRLGYKPSMNSEISLLSMEKSRILVDDESFDGDEVKVYRVLSYCP